MYMCLVKPQVSSNTQIKLSFKKFANISVLAAVAGLLCFSQTALAQQLSGVILNKQGKPINNAIVE